MNDDNYRDDPKYAEYYRHETFDHDTYMRLKRQGKVPPATGPGGPPRVTFPSRPHTGDSVVARADRATHNYERSGSKFLLLILAASSPVGHVLFVIAILSKLMARKERTRVEPAPAVAPAIDGHAVLLSEDPHLA